jgi:inorganic triphosphatase YgiF
MDEAAATLEVELRFTAPDDRPLAQLEAAAWIGNFALGPPQRSDEVDRYLDTASLRLERIGWACRLRLRGERWIVSLKGPPAPRPGDSPALHRRPELEGPATESTDPAGWPASEARRWLLGVIGDQPTAERLRLDQVRVERSVLDDADRALGVLSLDRVSALQAGRLLGRLQIVELEVRRATSPQLARLGAALSGVAGLRPETRTKLELALEMTADLRSPSG